MDTAMEIRIIAVGKIKEKFYRDAVAEFEKRLSRYCRLQIVEVQDEKTPENAAPGEQTLILQKEGERVLKAVHEKDYVVILAIAGKQLSSERFASFLEERMIRGDSRIVFVIGGSLGLSPAVERRGDLLLSFSEMTFPHQLMRIVLLEQIYRCFRIISHEPYHK